MSTAMNNQYVVIGSFVGLNHDVILDYFDTLEEAEKYEQKLSYNKKFAIDSVYNQIENTSIYQLKGVSND